MSTINAWLALMAATQFVCTVSAQTWTYPLNPRATFLRVNSDSVLAPLVVDLGTLGITPGAWLEVGTTGAYVYVNGGQDNYRSLVGVFSSSSQVLANNLQHRVPGAIVAGPSYFSGPTYHGSLPTDIPEDFFCSRNLWDDSIQVQVPPGATHLMLGTLDSLYSDNRDPNNDFGVVLRLLAPPDLPGTGEHLQLLGGVNGQPAALPEVHTAAGGATVRVELRYPLGLIDGSPFLLAADMIATQGQVPQLLPRVWLGNPVVVAIGGLAGTPGFHVPYSLTVPSGYAGISLLLQGGAITPVARNGTYLTTNVQRFDLQ